jgi:hypothetical protein
VTVAKAAICTKLDVATAVGEFMSHILYTNEEEGEILFERPSPLF